MRILALTTNPIEGASTRYRILAYIPFLEKQGWTVDFHPFFPSESLATVYSSGNLFGKTYYVIRGYQGRSTQLKSRHYDLVLVHRELFPLGLKVFLRRLRKTGARIVYDYDDAMFLPQRQSRGILGKLENPNSVKEIMAMSNLVVAGNDYLAAYARQYNRNVRVLATTVDTERYRPRTSSQQADHCTIGWIGSHTTVKYLNSLRSIFEILAKVHPFELKVVGASSFTTVNGLFIRQQGWSLEREVSDFQSCDIGVYPLWDDDWSKGKCGFKAIQFMAVGVPVVASDVGVNKEIIQDGVNGFLAASEQEWSDKLLLLIKDPELRREIGLAGRKTVEERYSLDVNAPKLLRAFQDVYRGDIT